MDTQKATIADYGIYSVRCQESLYDGYFKTTLFDTSEDRYREKIRDIDSMYAGSVKGGRVDEYSFAE